MNQMAITGEDWRSDADIKRQSRAEAARKKAALECSKKLEAAADALSEYLYSCIDCGDGSCQKGVDDSRLLLKEQLMEYKSWLDSKYT